MRPTQDAHPHAPFAGMTALITGASSGIGADFARELAQQGCHLILVARRLERLQVLQAALLARFPALRISCYACDLAHSAARQDLIAHCLAFEAQSKQPIDLLINNAGLGLYGAFATSDWAKTQNLIDVDIVALTQLSQHFAQAMQRRQRGYILNVASIVAHVATPNYAVYSASKHFVRAFSSALHDELLPSGVHVTTLSPGATQTEFFDTAGHQRNALLKAVTQNSRSVALAGLRGLARNQRDVIPGFMNRVTARLLWATPQGVLRWVLGAIF